MELGSFQISCLPFWLEALLYWFFTSSLFSKTKIKDCTSNSGAAMLSTPVTRKKKMLMPKWARYTTNAPRNLMHVLSIITTLIPIKRKQPPPIQKFHPKNADCQPSIKPRARKSGCQVWTFQTPTATGQWARMKSFRLEENLPRWV